ncbi:MAG: hypothetical protein LBS79_07750 [Tannerella sp.]|jgi:hypothetical protein|nr:hypothetical protein [Tannerella sp.]
MKKLFVYFAIISLFSAGAVSCGEDDDVRLSGKPVKIKCSDNTDVTFSYQGDRPVRITENGFGLTTEFGYSDGDLSSLSSWPTDPIIADGGTISTFTKEADGKIRIETIGFFPYSIVRVMEQDAGGFPVKITDEGRYTLDEKGVKKKERDGEYYSLFSWDASTGQLLKEEVCNIATSQRVAVYTYKYDRAPGVLSGVDSPLWLYTYWNYGRYFAFGTYHVLFFGHVNNLTEVTVDDTLNDRHEVVKYTYDYDANGFPVAVSIQKPGAETLTIQIQY